MPWIYRLSDYLTPIFGDRLGIAAPHGSIRKFAAKQVVGRKEKDHGQYHDPLSRLFEAQREKADEMNDNATLSMATSNVFASSDTTAISLRPIIYYLLKNSEYKKKFAAEIDELKKQGKLSDPVKLEEANDMPYLQACMY
jgi:cytochrome P450